MKEKNYYEILEVDAHASLQELTQAKNRLAKKLHPDANLRYGIDTTEQMQEILEAYRILSDPVSRELYDHGRSERTQVMQTFDLSSEEESVQDSVIVTCWKASARLSEIVSESTSLRKTKTHALRLKHLSAEAKDLLSLLIREGVDSGHILPETMNWILLRWLQNRNYTLSYLITLYDQHIKKDMGPIAKSRQRKVISDYSKELYKLMKY